MLTRQVWAKQSGITIQVLTKDKFQDALQLVNRAFYVDENVCKAVRVAESEQARRELDLLCMQSFQDGVTVIAVDDATGKLVGANFNKIQTKSNPGETFFEVFRDKECKHESSTAFMDFMIQVDARTDIYDKYSVDKTLELMFLMVDRDFRGRGISKILVQSTLDVARELGISIVNAMFTSLTSQKVGRAFQFDELVEVSHDDFVFDGKPITSRTLPTKSTILVAKRIVELV